jgi:hypothetical protein
VRAPVGVQADGRAPGATGPRTRPSPATTGAISV